MTITFAGMLLTAIGMIIGLAMVRTFVQYGASVSRLGRDLAECRDFIEMRMTQRPTTPLRALVSPAPAPRPVRVAEPDAIRAAA